MVKSLLRCCWWESLSRPRTRTRPCRPSRRGLRLRRGHTGDRWAGAISGARLRMRASRREDWSSGRSVLMRRRHGALGAAMGDRRSGGRRSELVSVEGCGNHELEVAYEIWVCLVKRSALRSCQLYLQGKFAVPDCFLDAVECGLVVHVGKTGCNLEF